MFEAGILDKPDLIVNGALGGCDPNTKIFEYMAEKFGIPSLPQFTGFPEDDDSDYPLILTSYKDPYFLHSSYRWLDKLRKHRPMPMVELHPDTAAKEGIREEDVVIIETRSGTITQLAHLTEKVHPRVIYAAYGWWFPEGKPEAQYEWEKSNFNILTTTDKLGKEFGTPNLKGICCRIRRK